MRNKTEKHSVTEFLNQKLVMTVINQSIVTEFLRQKLVMTIISQSINQNQSIARGGH